MKKISILLLCILVIPITSFAQNVKQDSLITVVPLDSSELLLVKTFDGKFAVSFKEVGKEILLANEVNKKPNPVPSKNDPAIKPCFELWSKAFASSLDKVTLNKIKYQRMDVKVILTREGKVRSAIYLFSDTSLYHRITSEGFLRLDKAIREQIRYQINWPSSNKQQSVFYTQALRFKTLFGRDQLLDSLSCVNIKGRELFSGKEVYGSKFIRTFFRDEAHFPDNAEIENEKLEGEKYLPRVNAPKQLLKEILISSFSKETLNKIAQDRNYVSTSQNYIFINCIVDSTGMVKYVEFIFPSKDAWISIPPIELFKLQQSIRESFRCDVSGYYQPFAYASSSKILNFSEILSEK